MSDIIISKEHAKKIGAKKYFTGKPCTHGHLSYRYMKSDICIACAKIHRDARLAADKKRRQQNETTWADLMKGRTFTDVVFKT